MSNWIPITGEIINSSLWDEEDWVIKIFFTMMAAKGAGDVWRGTAYALARASRKTEEDVLKAWKILSGPDRKRKEAQPHDGARIKKVKDDLGEGWLIINAELYRKRMSEELKRYRNRKAQRAWRARKEAVAQIYKSNPLPGEQTYLKTGEMPHELRETPPPYGSPNSA